MKEIYFTVPEDKMTHEGVMRHALGAAGSRCVAIRAEIRMLEMSLQRAADELEKAKATEEELDQALRNICHMKGSATKP